MITTADSGWLAGTTETGHRTHAFHVSLYRNNKWVAYCGVTAAHAHGAWEVLDPDILTCETCAEGVKREGIRDKARDIAGRLSDKDRQYLLDCAMQLGVDGHERLRDGLRAIANRGW